jgi:hypothetical protein
VTNESDEYTKYFPEDFIKIKPYQDEWEFIKKTITSHHEVLKLLTDQKEFAMVAKNFQFSGVLFMARKNQENPVKVLNRQKEKYRMELLRCFMEDKK